jgi:hypothetical protein
MYDCKKNCIIIGRPIGNETLHYILSAHNHAIIAQNKGDEEYMTKISKRISEMELKCK